MFDSHPTEAPTSFADAGRDRGRLLGVAALVALATVTLTGCGALIESATENALEEAIERAAESESGEDVEIDFDFDDDEASFTIETDEGVMVFDGDEDGGSYTIRDAEGEGSEINFGSETEAPDCVPSDLRLPAGFVGQSSMSGDGFCNFTAIAGERHDTADLADRYAEALLAMGYLDEDLSRSAWASDGSEQISVVADGDTTAMVGVTYQPDYYRPDGTEGPATIITVTLTD